MNWTPESDDEIIKVYQSRADKPYAYHFHNAYELILVVEGSADFAVNDYGREYGKNHIIFISNLEKHQMRPIRTPYIRYVLMVDPDLFDRSVTVQPCRAIFKQRPDSFRHGIPLDDETAARCRAVFESCIAEYDAKAPYYREVILARVQEMLILLYRSHSEYFPAGISPYNEEMVSAIQAYIDSRYSSELDLEEISAHFHLNKFHLIRIFRQVTGYTVKQYILLKRISHAKSLLYYSNRDVAQIAAESGFNSSSNFIRAFKSAEGVTPLAFRKLNLHE
ncbi:AraC family transcriptional regulator [Ruminococcaceae bacterium OttesenSCG-928-L11]|nr:AraC family transcriptional regulator [Ruminococcaceae bacterium OttesenSCG-928-L11]